MVITGMHLLGIYGVLMVAAGVSKHLRDKAAMAETEKPATEAKSKETTAHAGGAASDASLTETNSLPGSVGFGVDPGLGTPYVGNSGQQEPAIPQLGSFNPLADEEEEDLILIGAAPDGHDER